VWADEPTGALDSESAQDIMDLLCNLNRQAGQTLVMVTHALEIGEQANRIVRMRDGRIEDDGLTSRKSEVDSRKSIVDSRQKETPGPTPLMIAH